MTELLTAAQMRAIEAAAIASGEVTGLELMERAGRGVVEAVFAEWPELRAGSFRAVVLCGPGNNGGDGFVVARLLKEWGWEVEVFLYGTPEGMPTDARANYERWVGMGEVGPSDSFDPWSKPFHLLVDAIFGIGLTRAVQGDAASFLGKAAAAATLVDGHAVAVDLPSGLCSDSGRCLGPEINVGLTVTFGFAKRGHVLAGGDAQCGSLSICDIGLSRKQARSLLGQPYDKAKHIRADFTAIVHLVEDWPLKAGFSGRSSILDKGWIGNDGHKFSHGHAFILSGPSGQGGAARMTARGALRIGAGLVTVACPPDALAENAGRLDAIMLQVVADGAGLAKVLADPRITALCLGPGLGLDAHAADLVSAALGGAVGGDHAPYPKRPTVLDADALTLVSRDPGLFALLHENCVLTPHGGEFDRLFPDIAAKLDAPCTRGPAYSKVDATRAAAARAGCVVLFKGADTVIASPDGTCAINSAAYDRAAPWLATAGSGDVLAGFITGLLARGFAPQKAAEAGAWLHVECARSFGPGLIAEDLPEALPRVLRALGV